MIFKSIETKNEFSQINQFAKNNNICFQTAQILMQRGIDDDQKLDAFLHPNLQHMRNPFMLTGMEDCKRRIQQAIDNNQSILLFGDYDVDGISAVSILYKYLKDKVKTLNCFLPNRYEDGYGLTIQTAKKVIENYKPDLIITVDCGITCVEEVEYIKSQNIDIIITDHHEPLDELPKTIVIDPKIKGQNYGFDGLCGAGVALKIVQAFVGTEQLEDYLAICALATVSDIVPLVDENRVIVKLGLLQQERLPIGIKKLAKNLKLPYINSQAISFKLAPRLNASGRMGNAYTALNLFICDNREVINDSLNLLIEQNAQRQLLSQQIYADCLQQIDNQKLFKNRAIILKSENWDSGLLGIACARLVDDFCKPVFLFSEKDGELKGSVRSFGNINIHTLLSTCNQLLDTFGGHSMAAGLGLKSENYYKFVNQVLEYLQKNTTANDFLPIKTYDVSLKIDDLTVKFAQELELLEPFGCDNLMPQFMLDFQNCKVSKLANFENHLSLNIEKIKFLHFNGQEFFDDYVYSQTKHIIFELQTNEFKGKTYLKGIVKYCNFNGCEKSLQSISNGRILKQLYNESQTDKHINFFKKEQSKQIFDKLLADAVGTAIIIYDFNVYQKYKEILSEYHLQNFVGESQSKFAENCIVFALDDVDKLKNYKNLIFLDGLLSRSFVKNFNGDVFATNDNLFHIENLKTERSYFGQIFKSIKNVLQNNLSYSSEMELYKLVRDNLPNLKNLSYCQFVFCLYVFFEIGVLKLNTQFGYVVSLYEDNKTSLENSSLYNKMKLLQKIK